MSCSRIEELDLPGFLEDPTDEEFLSFQEHYPGCRDCSAEIRVWTELHMELGADAHPSTDELLSLQDAPASLPTGVRARLLAHVASCASCTEEIRSLESFAPQDDLADDPDEAMPALLSPSAPPIAESFAVGGSGRAFHAEDPSPGRPSERELEPELHGAESAAVPAAGDAGTPSPLAQIRRVVWTPAFAYAALLVVTLPLLYLRRDVVVEPIRQSTELAATGDTSRKAKREALAPPAEAVADEATGAPAAVEQSDQAFALEEEVIVQPMAAPAARRVPAPASPPRQEGRLRALGYAESAGVTAAPVEAIAPEPRAEAVRDGADLRVTVLTHLPGTGPLELLVRTPSGRELRQPVARPSNGATIELRLPAAWLGVGKHRIELRNATGQTETFDVQVPPAAARRRLG